MRLSTKGRYAVMALVDLAAHSKGAPVSLADISERQNISLSYLEQLFGRLRRGELVKSVRGPGGGYLLQRGAASIRIADAVLAVDENLRATRCTPGTSLGCTKNSSRCLTHDLWEELGNHIYMFLCSVTIQDVLDGQILGAARGRSSQQLAMTSPQPETTAL
jgi:Rrf2 family iron-sulfur cluster assembly transcriptional regulator